MNKYLRKKLRSSSVLHILFYIKLNKEVKMNLDRLKEIRKEQKLSQENIARALDISLRSYQMKEKGSNSFTFDEVIKIANALNMGEIEFIREIL